MCTTRILTEEGATLSGVVRDDVIAGTLLANDDPDRVCDELIARALEGGAPDNVTCVVFRVREAPNERPSGARVV